MARDGFIEVEHAVRLYFREIGEGHAVVIPLVDWTEEFDAVANGRRIIFYDPRGRGKSSAIGLEWISFENDVRDLEDLRKQLELESFSLIGWSHYGGVVARYAMEFPEHVRRLVIVCGPPIRRSPHADTMNGIMMERINAVAPGFLQELQGSESSEPEKLRKLWELVKRTRAGRPLRQMRGDPSASANESPEKVAAMIRRLAQTQGDWDWREDAKRVTCPALVVVGTADYLPLDAAQEWVEALPDAYLLKMEGVGHFPSLESPEEFFDALENFLRDH
jgi:proline iminopeptidase